MSSTQIQAWIGIVGGLAAALLGVLQYFRYRTRRDKAAEVGQAFNTTIDGLNADGSPKQLAAAILLRRFFDKSTEQGSAGTPYGAEAVAVIAALLRGAEQSDLQKLLADGLGYAGSLRGADLQACNLTNAYLGRRVRARNDSNSRVPGTRREKLDDSPVDISSADLFRADLTGASLRSARGRGTVFYEAVLVRAVLEDADLSDADFRMATLTGARFTGAVLSGARFGGAIDIPSDISARLDANGVFVDFRKQAS